MHDEIFPYNMTKMPSLKVAKAMITDFKKVGSFEMVLDLMLFYVECGDEFINNFGDNDGSFCYSLCSVFGQFVDQLNSKGTKDLYLRYKERIENLVSDPAHIGFGYRDFICEKSFELDWFEEE